MMLTLIVKVMNEQPDGSDILFLTDERSKSRDQTCLGFALQGGGRRSQRAGGAAVVIELTFGEGQK